MPKEKCIQTCGKIAAIQELQEAMRTPPYPCDDSSDTFSSLSESPWLMVRASSTKDMKE